jgi:hypothetical protein
VINNARFSRMKENFSNGVLKRGDNVDIVFEGIDGPGHV